MARAFQVLVLLATVLVIVGLIIQPGITELVLWSIIIPVLPATFLISPEIWRSICPLATLNMLGNGFKSKIRIGEKGLFRAEIIGITLFLVLVPARRFLLNENGPVLAVLIILIAVGALGLGLFFASKAGFCNSICPVLPIEKIYGQSPLLKIKNPRCLPCDACTLKGCYDLDVGKSLSFSLRHDSHNRPEWTRTTFGLFAAGLPGFILAYFLLEDTALGEAPWVYAKILGLTIASGAVFQLIFELFKVRVDYALLFLGTLAVVLYYWFSGPAIATAFDLNPQVGIIIRAVAMILIGVWGFQAVRRISEQESVFDELV